MKRKSSLLLGLVLFFLTFSNGLRSSPSSTEFDPLNGRVVDSSSDLPISSARVTIVELGRHTVTNSEGRFEFRNVPAGVFTIGIHQPGYKTEHLLVDFSIPGEIRVALIPGYQFQDEITVSATPWAEEVLRIPQQIDQIDRQEINYSSHGSLARMVKEVPGVRAAVTGDSASKPFIRGLSGNRVRILNNGFPSSHQQFGIRHQPNVETLGLAGTEIVRGPASVLYGADAMGGVLNLIQPPLPVAEGSKAAFHGELYGAVAGAADEGTGFIRLEGAVGGFGWRGSFVRRSMGNIDTPSETLDGTDFDQTNGDAAIGYTGSRGSIRLRWHHWENNFGFFAPKGFRIDLNDDLIAVDSFLPSRVGNFEFSFGRQNNIRKAFPPALGGEPAVHLDLDNTVIEGRFHHRKVGVLRGTAAVQFSDQKNTPLALGRLLPEYDNNSWAISLFEQAGFEGGGLEDRWLLSGAIRYDRKRLEVPPDPSRDLPDGYQNDWGTATFSAGLLYRLSRNLSLAGSVGRGWRAPSEFELFVDGVHGGVGAIQIGDLDLEEETNLNTELSLRWSAPRTRGYVTFFNNDFDNYIFLFNTGEIVGELPVFEHHQADAYLRGIETGLELMLTPWFETSAGFDYLKTRNKETGRKLPLTYPERFLWSARLKSNSWRRLKDVYAEIGLTWSGEGSITGPEEPFPFDTESYTVFRAAAGTAIPVSEDVRIGVDFLIDNLFNTSYRDFLYTYKGVADMPGRDLRLVVRLVF